MNELLSKLGITPGPWELGELTGHPELPDSFAVIKSPIKKHSRVNAICITGKLNYDEKVSINDGILIAAAPEMLEALIDDIQSYEFSPGDMFPISNYKRNKSIVEKATAKTWEEIKELLTGSEPVQLIQKDIIDPQDWDMDADIPPEDI